MYQLLKLINSKQLLSEVPAFGVSLIISETVFKFGSFTLETIAFLSTWYVLGLLVNKLSK
jgi:hypothetical protein